ncbi:MAG: hypothetical protein IPN03_23855 [Holophagales bacterium]|nr:hypothetical protein [Holophagales bacterium]
MTAAGTATRARIIPGHEETNVAIVRTRGGSSMIVALPKTRTAWTRRAATRPAATATIGCRRRDPATSATTAPAAASSPVIQRATGG